MSDPARSRSGSGSHSRSRSRSRSPAGAQSTQPRREARQVSFQADQPAELPGTVTAAEGDSDNDSDWDPDNEEGADSGDGASEGDDDPTGAGNTARIFSQILRQIGGEAAGSQINAANISQILSQLAEQGLLHQDEDGNLVMLADDEDIAVEEDDNEEEGGMEDDDEESQPESKVSEPEAIQKDDEAVEEFAEYTRLNRARRYPNNVLRSLQSHRDLHRSRPPANNELSALAAPHIPNVCNSVERFEGRAFAGKFSHAKDGSSSRFATATQDGLIHLYETDTWKLYKEIAAREVGWSIVDLDFSTDSRFVIYSSWSNAVHLINTQGEYELHEAFDFYPDASQQHVCMFGIRFSPNESREILAGMNSGVAMLYDIERKRRIWSAQAHDDDINTVCWLDDSGNLFATGSDDHCLRIWDRRLLGNDDEETTTQTRRRSYNRATPVGGFLGHVHGLTCVSAMPDGNARYLLSNSKDQSMKLWDIRRMMSPSEMDAAAATRQNAGNEMDYRWRRLSRRDVAAEAAAVRRANLDSSVVTFTGHSVSQTLIRCEFSPQHTTGFRYAITGSSDGNAWIYDCMTGACVQKLSGHQSIVRDVSWQDHTIVTSSWDHSVRRYALHKEQLANNGPFRAEHSLSSRRMERGVARRVIADDDDE